MQHLIRYLLISNLFLEKKEEKKAMASNSNYSDRKKEECLRCGWKRLQHDELTELEEAVHQAKKGEKTGDELKQLIQKIIQHFQQHSNAKNDVSPFFALTTGFSRKRSLC